MMKSQLTDQNNGGVVQTQIIPIQTTEPAIILPDIQSKYVRVSFYL